MNKSLVKLGDLVRIRTGKLDANASDPEGKYPFFTCAREPLRISTHSFDCECVLIAGNGDLNVKYFNGKFDAYQRTYVIEPLSHEILNVRYLYHFMDTYLEELRHMSIGGVIKYIKLGNLTEAKFPMPPLSEQLRIAAILDQADAFRVQRREVLLQLDSLTQSIFIEMFGDPVNNPKKWNQTSLGEVLSNIDSGWSPTCLDRPVMNEEWGVLKLGAMTRCEYNDAENKALQPNTRPRPELEVQAGDLLFTRKNTYDLVAACVLVQATRPRLLMPDLIFRFRLRPDAGVDTCYLHQLLINPAKRREIQKLASGSSGSMPNISKAKLQTAKIEIPPLAMQIEFSNRVTVIEKLKATHRAALAELDTLFASLQHRAFRGEL